MNKLSIRITFISISLYFNY